MDRRDKKKLSDKKKFNGKISSEKPVEGNEISAQRTVPCAIQELEGKKKDIEIDCKIADCKTEIHS